MTTYSMNINYLPFVTGKIWRYGERQKNEVFCIRSSFTKSTKKVFNMHGVWHSTSTFPAMAQVQAFCIIS